MYGWVKINLIGKQQLIALLNLFTFVFYVFHNQIKKYTAGKSAIVVPNAVNFAIAEMIGQLLTLQPHPIIEPTASAVMCVKNYRIFFRYLTISKCKIFFSVCTILKKLTTSNQFYKCTQRIIGSIFEHFFIGVFVVMCSDVYEVF